MLIERREGRLRNPWTVIGLLLVTAAPALPAAAADRPATPTAQPQTEGRPREAVPPAELVKKMEAAARSWDLKDAAGRLARPGADGQHDLLWEIAKLGEKAPKARQDQDLLAVADWLLFEAGLWREPLLVGAVATVTSFAPEMEAKLLGQRLKVWISLAAPAANAKEPWLWPEYRNEHSKALARAVKDLWKEHPRNNPIVRAWMAAALAAVDLDEGTSQLSEARQALAQDLPAQAKQLDYAIANSLANGGAKAGLPLLLELANAEIAKAGEPTAPRAGGGPVRPSRRGVLVPGAAPGTAAEAPPTFAPTLNSFDGYTGWIPCARGAFSPSLSSFYGLAGWIPSLLPEADSAAVRTAEAAKWLKENFAELDWDQNVHRFVGGRPQPGLEPLLRSAQAVDKKFSAGCMAALAVLNGLEAAVVRVVGIMEQQPAAARGKVLRDFLLVATDTVRRAHGESLCTPKWREALYVKLPGLDRDLGVELWQGHIRNQLLRCGQQGPTGLADLSVRYLGVDLTLVDQARRALEPELRQVLKKEDAAPTDALRHNLAYLFAGGKVEDGRLVKLLEAAKPENPMERHGVRVWASVLSAFNEPSGLRLLLLDAKADPEMLPRCLSDFEYLTGLSELAYDKKLEELGPAERSARVDQDLRWLAANQGKLSWDPAKRRFGGAAAAERTSGGGRPEALRPNAPVGENAGSAGAPQRELF
jgi:hypothetical protein